MSNLFQQTELISIGLFSAFIPGGRGSQIDHLCIPLRGNIPLGGNNLFAACYRDVGKKIF